MHKKRPCFLGFFFFFFSQRKMTVKLEKDVIPTAETKLKLGGVVDVPPIGK